MLVSMLGEKGQVSIPAEVRTVLGLREGDKLVFNIHNHQVILSKKDIQDDDTLYYQALSCTLNEWNSEEDDDDYCNL